MELVKLIENRPGATALEKDYVVFVNQHIEQINQKIRDYNSAPTNEQLSILREINSLRKMLEDSCPQDINVPDFDDKILVQFFKSCKHEFTRLNYPMNDADPSNSPELHAAPFTKMLAEMEPETVSKMAEILSEGIGFKREKWADFVEENQQYRDVLRTYQITYEGGRNAKNFKLTSLNPSDYHELILRVDNRLGGARATDHYLRTTAFKEVLTPAEAARAVAFNSGGEVKKSTLFITNSCPGGTPLSHAMRQDTNDKKISGALDLYQQMGEVLIKLQHENCLHPDAKNSNWLIDSQGKLRISDTKALVFSHEGLHDYDESFERNRWTYGSEPSLIATPEFSPPEIRHEQFIVDRMHSFILGKNIYQYLTGEENTLQDASSFTFPPSIFSSEEGEQLKGLIQALVKPDPFDRMSVNEAVKELTELKEKDLRKPVVASSCEELIKKLESYTLDKPDAKMQDYTQKLRADVHAAVGRSDYEALFQLEQKIIKLNQDNKKMNAFLSGVITYLNTQTVGVDKKISAIKKAYNQIPVEERGQIMDTTKKNTAILQIRAALGTWRTCLGNFSPILPSYSINFQKYRQQFTLFKPPADKQEEEQINSMLTTKRK